MVFVKSAGFFTVENDVVIESFNNTLIFKTIINMHNVSLSVNKVLHQARWSKCSSIIWDHFC